MKWAKRLRLFRKADASQGVQDEGDTSGDIVHPDDSDDDTQSSRPKRRSVSIDAARVSFETTRRTSLEKWHEARRVRNSLEGQPPAATVDKLTVCKAGHTTIVNKKYLAIKHLGAGSFGRVVLCLNIKDQKLYAIKTCRKASCVSHARGLAGARFRRLQAGVVPQLNVHARGLPERATDSTASSSLGSTPFGRRGSAPFAAERALCRDAGMIVGEKRMISAMSATFSGSACSSYNSGDGRAQQLAREIAILKRLNHPNIVQLVEVIDDPSTDRLLLVMEYVEGRTLEPAKLDALHWQRLPEQETWHYARGVLQGLRHLHLHGVVHGDLKPANLLFDNNSSLVKIVDFGSSKMGSESCGGPTSPAFTTPAFRSPESLTSGYQLSFELDMWALGVCIYLWTFGQLPFSGAGPYAVYDKIRLGQFAAVPDVQVSPELMDLITGLLERDVCSRLNVEGAAQHPWVTQHGAVPLPPLHAVRDSAAGVAPTAHDVSQEELDAAIVETYGSVEEFVAVAFEERHFQDRELIVQAGDPADHVFLIAAGEVEIFQDRNVAAGISADQPFISGVDMETDDAVAPEFVDLRVPEVDHGAVAGAGYPQRSSSFTGAALHRAGGEDAAQKVFVVKGPGESFGLPCLHGGSTPSQEHIWKACVRARGAVTLFVSTGSSLRQLVRSYPEIRAAVEEMVGQQDTDLRVTEAMRQLKLFAEIHKGNAGPVQMAGQHQCSIAV